MVRRTSDALRDLLGGSQVSRSPRPLRGKGAWLLLELQRSLLSALMGAGPGSCIPGCSRTMFVLRAAFIEQSWDPGSFPSLPFTGAVFSRLSESLI